MDKKMKESMEQIFNIELDEIGASQCFLHID